MLRKTLSGIYGEDVGYGVNKSLQIVKDVLIDEGDYEAAQFLLGYIDNYLP